MKYDNIDGNAARCNVDPDCQDLCRENTLCTPLKYGYHGILLPSAETFRSWFPLFPANHWPMWKWNYIHFQKHEVSVGLKVVMKEGKSVHIFNSDAFVSNIFSLTANTDE